MNYAGSGMVQPGKWIHRDTGREIYVRDSIIDGDHMIIMTNNGQIGMDEFQNYIQVSEEEFSQSSQGILPEVSSERMIDAINNGIESDDKLAKRDTTQLSREEMDVLTKGLDTVKATADAKDNSVAKQDKALQKKREKSPNYSILKKIFDKFDCERTIVVKINDEEWPLRELATIMDLLDISVDEVSSYAINEYLDEESIKNALAECLKEALKNAV